MTVGKTKTSIPEEILCKVTDRTAEGYKKPGVRLKEEKKKNTINSRKKNKRNY